MGWGKSLNLSAPLLFSLPGHQPVASSYAAMVRAPVRLRLMEYSAVASCCSFPHMLNTKYRKELGDKNLFFFSPSE